MPVPPTAHRKQGDLGDLCLKDTDMQASFLGCNTKGTWTKWF